MLDGSGWLSIGSWKLVPSSFKPRYNDRSSANSAFVSTRLAAPMKRSAGGTGFIETNPATFSGCSCANMNTTLPPVGDALGGEVGGGRRGQMGQSLDGPYLAREPAEDRRLVAESGADLEHAFAAAQREGVDHRRHQRRLRRDLAGADRDRAVEVGFADVDGRHVARARHGSHGVEHARVAHAGRARGGDERMARHIRKCAPRPASSHRDPERRLWASWRTRHMQGKRDHDRCLLYLAARTGADEGGTCCGATSTGS